MSKVCNLTLHNDAGESVLASDLVRWAEKNSRIFYKTSVSWLVNGQLKRMDAKSIKVSILPDNSGLICFDDDRDYDNGYILDAYGKLRYRLRVPWELTGLDIPKGAKMWFRDITSCIQGTFGAAAWIEYAGDYYFELDYHEGKFLWGKKIRY